MFFCWQRFSSRAPNATAAMVCQTWVPIALLKCLVECLRALGSVKSTAVARETNFQRLAYSSEHSQYCFWTSSCTAVQNYRGEMIKRNQNNIDTDTSCLHKQMKGQMSEQSKREMREYPFVMFLCIGRLIRTPCMAHWYGDKSGQPNDTQGNEKLLISMALTFGRCISNKSNPWPRKYFPPTPRYDRRWGPKEEWRENKMLRILSKQIKWKYRCPKRIWHKGSAMKPDKMFWILVEFLEEWYTSWSSFDVYIKGPCRVLLKRID